jgi:hypothetical protein
MSAANSESVFMQRFNQIWSQARRVELTQAACWALLTALAGLALLAAADYWLELSRPARIVALGLIGVSSLAVASLLATRSFRRWQRQATAATIERTFPQVGQRIRTTVQFSSLTAGELACQGVAGTLVGALDEDTFQVAEPLPLDAVVPWRPLALVSLLAAAIGIALAGASALDWEWRAAARRAFLGEQPYTKISVEPGDAIVREGESLLVQIKVEGRIGSQIVFESRRTDDQQAPWQPETLRASDATKTDGREALFEVPLNRIRHPLEYKVAAGSAHTEAHRVAVLFPLKMVRQKVTITPPEYTGLAPTVSETGEISALVGSHLQLEWELDRTPNTAWMELHPLVSATPGEEPAVQRVPLAIDGAKLSAEIDLTSDQAYSIIATAADGMELPKNSFRLRAQRDQPPQVWFDSPSEAIEVHTLAEVLMRIRTSDDFGLSRAGIMFQVNNEELYPLLDKDFKDTSFKEAAEELATTGRLTPQTRATLESILPLEHFQLSQQDSVMYYAFAEDNRPDRPQRTETDLRFIDIRPFRRNYRLLDPADGAGRRLQLTSLRELIARQRYALNRTIQLDKKAQYSGQADVAATDSLVKFETELAQSTREFAEGLLARGIDDIELLFQAETSMLASADSLAAGNYETATLQMRDALKYLIEGRNRLEIFISRNGNRQLQERLRAFDRMQRQKLRRPKSDEEATRQIVQQLKDLADREDSIAMALGGAPSSEDMSELEERQIDAAAEAREVETALGKLPKATDLAKQRMAAAAKRAEEAAEAIGKATTGEAGAATAEARDQFRELAQQAEGLLAEEQAKRIAAARDMAADLANRQKDFAQRMQDEPNPLGRGGKRDQSKDEDQPPGMGRSKDANEQQAAGMGGKARELAEKARTLADVLGAAAKPQSPEDQKSADEIARILKSLELNAAIDRLAQLPAQIESKKLEDARLAALDGAERMEAAAEQLAKLHRNVVAPKIEELSKLEQMASRLNDEVDALESDPQITTWHVQASELIQALEEAEIEKELRLALEKEMREEMRKAGWNAAMPRGGAWARKNGTFAVPAAYHNLLTRIAISLRSRMQEYLLGEMRATGDEPIPPQYRDFVDRYYKLIAGEDNYGRQRSTTPAASAKEK